MSASEFVDLVRDAGEFDTDERARQVTTAVLSALGSAIEPGEAQDLAVHLPGEFEDQIVDAAEAGAGPPPYDEFRERIREGADVTDAEAAVRAVTAALVEFLGEDEVDDVRSQLPPEYSPVFAVGEVPSAERFVERVAERSDLGAADAAAVTEAVLATFGERLTRGEAEDVAAHLTGDAADWIIDQQNDEAEAFGVEEFRFRMAERTDLSEAGVEDYAGEVTAALEETVPESELSRFATQLPAEYDAVLGFSRAEYTPA